MASDRRRLLADWPHRLRETVARWPARFHLWRAAVKADPTLLWSTPAVRIALWVILGVGLIAGARWLARAIAPRGSDAAFESPTASATLYVACTHADCRASYTTHKSLHFNAWPLTCPECGRASVYRAEVCPTCGQWFATAPGQPVDCPHCARARATSSTSRPTDTRSSNPDDAEDPWK